LRAATSVARWWWPTLSLAGFGAVAGFVLGHDHPGPGRLSTRGLLTIALAALVVFLLTLHRTAGPGALARATAEYIVVALLAALLTLAGGLDQQPANPATPATKAEITTRANAGEDRPGILRVAAAITRTVTNVIRAVTGAASWVVDLWRQADQQTNHPSHSPATTTPKAEAMAPSPALTSTSTRRTP
jgi:hypothetical protein